MKDQYGNPFQIIELTWNTTPLRRCATNSKTKGFEDTHIRKDIRGMPEISYRRPGTVVWLRTVLGLFVGKCAKTPHNMTILAANFDDNLWAIKDSVIRAEVEAMAKKLKTSLSSDMRKFHDKRIKESNLSPFDKKDDTPYKPDVSMEEKQVVEDRFALSKQEKAISEKKAALDKREADLKQRELSLIDQGVPSIAYSKDALMKMQIARVKQLLRDDYGHSTPREMTKSEAVDALMECQAQAVAPAVSDGEGAHAEPVIG